MSDRWHRLATYNAEVYRGIVHTPEYDAEMAEEQRAFDAEHGVVRGDGSVTVVARFGHTIGHTENVNTDLL